jgi:hypothetical protein
MVWSIEYLVGFLNIILAGLAGWKAKISRKINIKLWKKKKPNLTWSILTGF